MSSKFEILRKITIIKRKKKGIDILSSKVRQIKHRDTVWDWDICGCVCQSEEMLAKRRVERNRYDNEGQSCASAVMVCATSDRALHYLMLCLDHCEPQKQTRETATDVQKSQTQAVG